MQFYVGKKRETSLVHEMSMESSFKMKKGMKLLGERRAAVSRWRGDPKGLGDQTALILELDGRTGCALLLEPRLEHICAQSDASATVLCLVARAQEAAVRARDVFARRGSGLATVQSQRRATPAFLTVLNTSKVVARLGGVTLLQALFDGLVRRIVVDLSSEKAALVRFREAAVIGVVDVAFTDDGTGRGRLRRSRGARASL